MIVVGVPEDYPIIHAIKQRAIVICVNTYTSITGFKTPNNIKYLVPSVSINWLFPHPRHRLDNKRDCRAGQLRMCNPTL